MSVYDDIKAERQRQDEKWGGPEHDDLHHEGDWVEFILEHANKALVGPGVHLASLAGYRRRLVEVAALAVAAIESLDRSAPTGGEDA